MKDAVVALDIDKPIGETFDFRGLQTPGFAGTLGDGLMHVVGMTGRELDDGSIELFVINYRPSVDAVSGTFADQASVGANATIEIFKAEPGASTIKHVRTVADPLIATPNRVAALDRGFYITNDHGIYKTGLVSELFNPAPPFSTVRIQQELTAP